MTTPVVLPSTVVLEHVRRLLEFPHPTICRHYVAGELLDALEKAGMVPDEVFRSAVNSVVQADDGEAIDAINTLILRHGGEP